MKTKAKKFSHKLLALLMALVMAVTCFSGVLTSFAASNDVQFHDEYAEYNSLGWAILSEEQVATAVLDWADQMLDEYAPSIYGLLSSSMPATPPGGGGVYWSAGTKELGIKYSVLNIKIGVNVDSVDDIFKTVAGVHSTLDGVKGIIGGDVKNINFGAVYTNNENSTKGTVISRSNMSSTDLIKRVFAFIQKNSGDYNGADILGQFLRGNLNLGLIKNFFDIYQTLGNALNLPSGYEDNLVYNLVREIIFNNTKWYTEEEIAAFHDGTETFVFDTELLDKMTTELLDRISVQVTYDQAYTAYDLADGNLQIEYDEETGKAIGYKTTSNSDSSYTRYKKIMDRVADPKYPDCTDYASAAESLGYDPNIVYSDEFKDNDGNYKNVLLFAYGSPDENGLATAETNKIILNESDSLFKFGFEALKFAWNTVLKDTVKLLHVNYDVERGHGSNFDNAFYYYMDENGLWNRSDIASNYSQTNIENWADHLVWVDALDENGDPYDNAQGLRVREQVSLYESYGAESAEEFLTWVAEDLTHDRELKEGSTGSWEDIDATKIANKVRYSPLVDYYFNKQSTDSPLYVATTGPINLYFMQMGTPNLDEFFDDISGYKNLVALLNDALVAALKDIFVQSSCINGTLDFNEIVNIGSGEDFATIGSSQITQITNTLVANALKVVQYTADAIDSNILKAFYDADGVALTESNLETAMLPLLISCVGQISIDGRLNRMIHKEDWNKCKDAEAVAYLALREYLAYVLPDFDYTLPSIVEITDTEINATLEGTLLPMARDAIMYVIESYVPIRDASGNAFKVEKNAPGTADYCVQGQNDLFTLLNSVVCYYGGDYETHDVGTTNKGFSYANRNHGLSMGIGALLGLCDSTTGRSLITQDNTLWQNIDLVVNKLLPVVGKLQGKGYGNASSEELIWETIVEGILQIAPSEEKPRGGVSNFVDQLLTIVSATPIQSTSIVLTVYDVLEGLINGVLGARYTGQTFTTVVPVNLNKSNDSHTTTTPFNDAIQVDVLAGTDGTSLGIVQMVICNITEFTGYSTGGDNTYPDSIMRGIMFALQAVNNFLPNVVPTIGEHQLNPANAEFKDLTKTGAAKNTEYTDTVTVTNDATGVNTTYIEGMGTTDQAVQQSRYYVYITGASITGTGQSSSVTTTFNSPVKVAPAGTADIAVKYKTPSDTAKSSYSVIVNYYIGSESGEHYVDNLQTTAYKYVTDDISWIDQMYPAVHGIDSSRVSAGVYELPSSYDEIGAGKSIGSGKFTVKATSTVSGKGFHMIYPEYISVAYSDLGSLPDLGICARLTGKNERGMDGVYCYDVNNSIATNDLTTAATTEGTTTTTSVGIDNAIPVYDKSTGDLLQYGLYDVWDAENEVWLRGENGSTDGFSSVPEGAKTRVHVVYTLQEALEAKIIQAYHINSQGYYDYIYLKSGGGVINYDNLLKKISMRGPVDGIYLNTGKITVQKGDYSWSVKNTYFGIGLTYDGETLIKTDQEYDFNLAFYSSAGPVSATMHFSLCDDSAKTSIIENYNKLRKLIDEYKPSDFTDYENGSSDIYNNVKNQLIDALKARGAVVHPDNATQLSDQQETVAKYKVVASQYGDKAYIPYTVDNVEGVANEEDPDVWDIQPMPRKVLADAYKDSSGIYYSDSDMTLPIYTNIPLTDADVDSYVDDGITYCSDAAGISVIKNPDTEVWHILNFENYVQEWYIPDENDTVYSYPIKMDTEEQSVNGNNDPEYKQNQYVYRDSSGNKCNSDENWVCKMPEAEMRILEPDYAVEHRGTFTQVKDNLQYWREIVEDSVDTSIATKLFTEMTMVRTGLNQNNFDIVTFNKMTKVAKAAESNYKVIVPAYTDLDGNKHDEAEMKPSDAAPLVKSLIEDEIITINDITTKSSLSSMQVDNYIRMFNEYVDKIIERGYLGDKLEEEIICTTGNTYNNLNYDDSNVEFNEETWTYTTGATITLDGGVTDTKFGTFKDGLLVNEDADGNKLYTDASWNWFTVEIAKAIKIADRGNSDTYPTRNYYNETNEYDAAVTTCYTEFKDLRRSEIALEPYVEETSAGFNVSASLVIATNGNGATANKGVTGTYTITLLDTNDEIVAQTEFASTLTANTFTLDNVPNGTYTAVITSAYSLERNNITVIVNGDNVEYGNIPIIACNFDGNSVVNSLDFAKIYAEAAGSGNLVCDLDGNSTVNSLDFAVVYSCAASGDNLPDIIIQ